MAFFPYALACALKKAKTAVARVRYTQSKTQKVTI